MSVFEGATGRRWATWIVVAAVISATATLAAQRRFFYGWDETVRNIPYDGRFTFVRIKYTPAPGGNWAGGRPSWVHGYPVAEQNLMRIMKEISFLDAHADDMNVVTLDDPGAVPLSGRLHHRSRMVDDDRSGSRRRCAPISRKAGS